MLRIARVLAVLSLLALSACGALTQIEREPASIQPTSTAPLVPHVEHLTINGIDPCAVPITDSGAQLIIDINACLASVSGTPSGPSSPTPFGVTPYQFGASCNGVLTHDAAMSAATPSWKYATPTSSSSAVSPATTTTSANESVVTVQGWDNATYTPPGSPTQIVNISSAGNNYGLFIGYQDFATAQGVAAQTGSLSVSTDNTAGSILIPANGGIVTASGTPSTCQVQGNVACTLGVPSGSAAGDQLFECIEEFQGFNLPRGTATTSFQYAGREVSSTGQSLYCYSRTMQGGDSSFTFNALPQGQTGALIDFKNAGSPPAPTTSATITSASADFTSANIGQPVCVGGASNVQMVVQSAVAPVNLHRCGTITAVANSTSATLSFGNQNESALSGAELRFGHDDSTGLQAMFNSLETTGGTVNLPIGACVAIQPLTVPSGVSVNINGQGATRNLFANIPSTQLATSNTSGLWFLSDSLGGPGLTLSSAGNGFTGWAGHDWWHDFTVWFGAGLDLNLLGGGVNGIDIEGVSQFSAEDVSIENAPGNCMQFDTTGGGAGWIADVRLGFNVFEGCGGRGVMINGGGIVSSQNFDLEDNTVENNGLDGVATTGGIADIKFGNDIIQRDDNTSAPNIYEVNFGTSAVPGCAFEGGNYFEVDGQSMISLSSPINDPSHYCSQGPSWTNFSNAVGGYPYPGPIIEPNLTLYGPFVPLICSGSGSSACPSVPAWPDGRVCATDSAACSSGSIYAAGGGSTRCEVWSNGSGWVESGSGC